MKQFLHHKLGREARRKEIRYEDNIHRYEIGKLILGNIVYVDGRYTYTEQELLALGFEEEEEGGNTYSSGSEIKQEDWIDKAFDYYYQGESLYAFEECAIADARIFREAINRHLPPQKKITIQQLGDYLAGYGHNSLSLLNALENFLRDHGLLEE